MSELMYSRNYKGVHVGIQKIQLHRKSNTAWSMDRYDVRHGAAFEKSISHPQSERLNMGYLVMTAENERRRPMELSNGPRSS
jgi:hypothetical protein